MTSPQPGATAPERDYGKSRHRERAELLGYEISSHGSAGSQGVWRPTEFMSNSRGVVHGGLVGAVIDDIAAMAVFGADPTVVASATVTMHIDYLLPLVLGGEYTCTGEVLRVGGRFAVADARVVDAEGKLCIRGSGTFAITRASTMNSTP